MKFKALIFIGLILFPLFLFAQQAEDAGFRLFNVVSSWFGDRVNGYIIAAENNEAIIIDPVDDLERIKDTYQLVDPDTRQVIQLISSETLTKDYVFDSYTRIATNETTQKSYIINDYYQPIQKTISNFDKIIDENKLNVKYIVVSHGHLDHFAAINHLREKTGAKIVMNVNDTRALDGTIVTDEAIKNGALVYPKDSNRIKGINTPVDLLVGEGDTIKIADLEFSVMLLPGHSYGSIALYNDKAKTPTIFVGDVLIKLSVGRTNFSDGTGSDEELTKSLKRLAELPDNTIVYSGHDEHTTIGSHKKYNYFMQKAIKE